MKGLLHPLSGLTIVLLLITQAFASPKVPVAAAAGVGGIVNGEFDAGTTGWSLDDYTSMNIGTMSVVTDAGISGPNALKIDITGTHTENWKLQLVQTLNFRIQNGHTYRVTFKSKAETAREITASIFGSSFWNYAYEEVSLTTAVQTYSFDYHCNTSEVDNEDEFSLRFYLAANTVSDVWLDAISIQDITGIVFATGVTVSPDPVVVNSNQTWQLTPTVQPANATNSSVAWTSANETVAFVNSSGLVTGNTPGVTTITATTLDGNFTASTIVKVAKEGTPFENGEFNAGLSGWTLDDFTENPASMSVVSDAGMSGNHALKVDLIEPNVENWKIQLIHHLNFRLESDKTYRVNFKAKSAGSREMVVSLFGNVNFYNYAYETVALTTSPQSYSFEYTCNESLAATEPSFSLKFYLAEASNDVWLDDVSITHVTNMTSVTSMSLNQSSLSLAVGGSATITASVLPEEATNKQIKWSTSNSNIAAVSSAGVVKAVATGSATITARADDGGLTASATVTVGSATPLDILDRYAFKYKYDSRNRMVAKKVPGADWVYMVYDGRDRLVMTQDGNQRDKSPMEWTFTKYDALNRPLLTGIYVDNSNRDRDAMQSDINQFYLNAESNSDEWYEQKLAWSPGAQTVHGYTNNSFPKVYSENSYLTVTYYDDYQFTQELGGLLYYDNGQILAEGSNPGQESENSNMVTGLTTGGKIKNLETQEWMPSVTYYDAKHRVIQTVNYNQMAGADRVTSVYDFSGKVLRTKTDHSAEGKSNIATARRFSYDHAGRLLKTEHAVGNYSYVTLSQNQFNELGQVVKDNLHRENGDDAFSQQVDYRYNIRGWLTRINNSDLSTTDGGPKDYFGMNLDYNHTLGFAGATPQYNGNISAIVYSTNQGLGIVDEDLELNEASQRGYVFEYDPMSRLTDATHQELTGEWMTSGSHHENGISYDLNGNIGHLNRKGDNASAMDNLSYTYAGNQLLTVSDGTSNSKGFSDGNTSGDDYFYDRNGNMVVDKNKSVDSITYNHLNLPAKVIKGTGEYLRYVYNSAGIKLAQEVYDAGDVLKKSTIYAGEFYYENDTLKFINHEKGRIVMQDTIGEYQYFLKDHLGNNRVLFTTKSTVDSFTATMEPGTQSQEENDFGNYQPIINDLLDHTDNGTVYDKVLVLNGGYNGQIGLTRSFAVVPGDTITAQVYAKFIGSAGAQSNLANIAVALTGAFGVTPSGPVDGTTAYDALNAVGLALANGGRTDDDTSPKGFINILVFDKEYNLVDFAFEQIDKAYVQSGSVKAPHQLLTAMSVIRQEGYAYVFLSNEGANELQIGFDDMEVKHTQSKVIQQEEYYPFGLTFNSYLRENSISQKYLYNGKEQINDLGLDWADYGARMYMPQIGRWGVVDMMLEKSPDLTPYRYGFNNPMRFLDPSGLYETDGHFWTVYLMGVLMGSEQAFKLASLAEGPDHLMTEDGNVIESTNTWMDPILSQGNLHALTGQNAEAERSRSEFYADLAPSLGWLGFALHRLGDSFAHTRMDGSGLMYGLGIGHALTSQGGHAPDLIANRPELYMQYVTRLAGVMAARLGFNSNVDLFAFKYIADQKGSTLENSAILETEIRIRQGVRSFTVEGNQVKSINQYLNIRGNVQTTPHANVTYAPITIYTRNKKGGWDKRQENRTIVNFGD
jgi:RHS repeat-associated protein